MSTASFNTVPPIKKRQTRGSKQEAIIAAIGGARGVAGIDEFMIYEVTGPNGTVFHYRYKDEPLPRKGALVYKAKRDGNNWVKQR